MVRPTALISSFFIPAFPSKEKNKEDAFSTTSSYSEKGVKSERLSLTPPFISTMTACLKEPRISIPRKQPYPSSMSTSMARRPRVFTSGESSTSLNRPLWIMLLTLVVMVGRVSPSLSATSTLEMGPDLYMVSFIEN